MPKSEIQLLSATFVLTTYIQHEKDKANPAVLAQVGHHSKPHRLAQMAFKRCETVYKSGSPSSESHSELAKVMIEMFVHSGAPLLRRERTEERMRMLRTLRFAALVKSPHAIFELLLFASEISLIGDDKSLVSRAVLRKWGVVGKTGAHKGSEYPADEHPWQNDTPRCHLKGRGAVRHHLRGIHLAPLGFGRWLQLLDARDYFFNRFGLK